MNLFQIIAFEITENIPCVENAVLRWPHDTNILRQIVALVILKHQKKKSISRYNYIYWFGNYFLLILKNITFIKSLLGSGDILLIEFESKEQRDVPSYMLHMWVLKLGRSGSDSQVC